MGARFGHALRATVSVLATLAMWLVASPAFAGEDAATGRSAAPQCDTRGATTFAPAPTLNPPQASIDTTDTEAECVTLTGVESFRNGAPSDDAPPPRADAVVPGTDRVSAPGASDLPGVHERADGARAGVRMSLERPPQA